MSTNPIDQALAAINENLRLSAADLKSFGAALFEIAKTTEFSFTNIADAATELARQGLSAEDVKKRVKDVLILYRIAGIDTSFASHTDSLAKAIGKVGESSSKAADSVNELTALIPKHSMTNHPPIDPLHFCYWLRGYTEVTSAKLPSTGEWQIINDHLNAVFTKVTPNREPTYCGSGSLPFFALNQC